MRNNKIKVMFFMAELRSGGAEKILLNILRFLPKDKYDITLLLLEKEGNLLDFLPNDIVCRSLIDGRKKYSKKIFYWRLNHIPGKLLYKKYVKELFDVEIAFLEGLATHLISCSTNKKSRKIAWVHTDILNNRWADGDFKNEKQQSKLYRKYNSISCVSRQCRDSFVKRFGNNYPLSIVYNVVDVDNIIAKSKDYYSNIKNNVFTIVSVGRFVEQKRFDRLLRIHKRLLDSGIKNNLYLVGDGTMRKDFEEYIIDNKLEKTVCLTGYQENPYPYIVNADLFVCSSRTEGYSSVVCEALILGVPVISTDVSGAGEILDNGKYGLIVNNDEDSLYNGIRLLIEDSNMYKKYKLLSQTRGKDFSIKSRINEVEKIINGH